MIYFFIILLLLISGLTEVNDGFNIKSQRITFCFIAFFFWILSFVRWECGTDWDSYYNCFSSNYTLVDFQNSYFEPLFYLLNYMVKQVTESYTIMLMITGAIIFSLSYNSVFKFSPLPLASLFVYLLLRRGDIFFVRESIALAFCLFSVRYIITRKLIPYLFIVAVATQFHNAAYLFIPAYFIYGLKMNMKTMMIGLLTVFVVISVLQDRITSTLGPIASLLGDDLLVKTDKYIERGYDNSGGVSVMHALVIGSLNRLIFLFFYLYIWFKYYKDGYDVNNLTISKWNKRCHFACDKSTIYRGLVNLYLISMVLFIILAPISLTLNRLSNYYEMSSIPLFGIALSSLPRQKRVPMFCLFSLYITIRFVSGTLLGVYSSAFLPFKTIFD